MIPPFLISAAAKLLGAKLAERFAKPLAALAMAATILAALFVTVQCVRRDAVNDYKAEQQAEIARQNAAQRVREAKATIDRANSLNASTARDRAKLEDIDNATANLPDARPTRRQLERSCHELRFTPSACAGLRPE